jgi:hypothetical protein
MSEFFHSFFVADLLLTCISICNQGTSEPRMARMLGVAKMPSNDTNDFEGRKRASEFIR